jgi:hypothetical protein
MAGGGGAAAEVTLDKAGKVGKDKGEQGEVGEAVDVEQVPNDAITVEGHGGANALSSNTFSSLMSPCTIPCECM